LYLQLVKVTADAALPAASGSATGTLSIEHVEALLNALGSVSATVTPDLDLGDVIEMNIGVNAITMAVPDNMAANNIANAFVFIITAGVGGTVTWNAKYKFPGGIAPTQTTTGTDVYAAIAVEGPTGNIHAVRVSEDSL